MKKTVFALTIVCFMHFLSSCTQDGASEDTTTGSVTNPAKNALWAEEVESKTIFIKPEGWEEEYWNSINKSVNHQEIFNTIADAVLSGQKKAYDLLTDSVLTVDEVKALVSTEANNTDGPDSKVGASDLSMIRMREKWVFDKEKFRLEKKVIRIDLTYKKLDENGKYIGDKPLFYVYLD